MALAFVATCDLSCLRAQQPAKNALPEPLRRGGFNASDPTQMEIIRSAANKLSNLKEIQKLNKEECPWAEGTYLSARARGGFSGDSM